ncbi:NAD(P)-dependent oxidoreductase [Aureimonas endophytica]|uniref:NAD(P)-dependent oxidoreductase n=1 Tax=Aureimonas endophytica TaxID=2027858 RepID=A0A917ECJ9_9HYPH|nr:SDR family oxidoreductase [Aureimonas endophytica]GGE23556.1 NAD(P)-dependent oxidoreductase [Aureimonas endophytica]
MRLFVFGCGYSAGAFVTRLAPDLVLGVTTRSPEKAASLAARGLKPFVFDGERPGEGIDAALERATHLLVSAAPGEAGDPVLRQYRDRLLHAMPALAWIGYLSTVGVYGDHGGAWVDEETPLRPVSQRSVERVAAEADWSQLAAARNVPLAILRLSGIYGPGRNAFVNLREGRAKRLAKPGQVFNRIHVEDIAGALAHLAGEGLGGVFNVTDDEPAPPQDVVELAARLVGAPLPPLVNYDEASLSPMQRSFYGENKRVSNAKIRASGYTFIYPSYRDALPSLTGDYRNSSSPNIS